MFLRRILQVLQLGKARSFEMLPKFIRNGFQLIAGESKELAFHDIFSSALGDRELKVN